MHRSYRLSNRGDPRLPARLSLQRSFVSVSYQPSTLEENIADRAGQGLQRRKETNAPRVLAVLDEHPISPPLKDQTDVCFCFPKTGAVRNDRSRAGVSGTVL